MTTNGIELIMTKAMSDAAFMDLLFNDLDKALIGFDLTSEEIISLKSMSRAEFDNFKNTSLEERKSFDLIAAPKPNHNEILLNL
jgi:hypothetical protein